MVSLRTYGQSMAPFFRDGDVLTLKKVAFSHLRVNDFITIKENSHFITHRVIYKSTSYLITKGDNNRTIDGKVYPRNIIGKVEGVKRDGHVIATDSLYLFQSTLYFAEIINVKNALASKGIDFVFLKGLPLHLYYEKSHPRRIYADCDILVRKEDYDKALSVFHALGYKANNAAFSAIHTMLKDKETEISFSKTVQKFPILFDVHLEPVFLMNQLGKLEFLYLQKYIDELTKAFLRTKKVVNIYHEDFPILSPENVVLYLALHIFHHNFKGYYRYEFLNTLINKVTTKSSRHNTLRASEASREVDSSRLRSNNTLDFLKLLQTIHRYKLGNFVYPVFALLKKHYDTTIPQKFLKAIKPRGNAHVYIKKNLLHTPIFDEELRIGAGIERFKNIFFLSPNPFYQRLFIFLNLQVLYSLFWILQKRLLRQKNLLLQKLFGKISYI